MITAYRALCAGRYPLLEQGALNDLLPVATGHGVPLPAAAVQFPLRHPAVATVCVGARSAEQVDRNVALFDVQIPDALWQELATEGLIRADIPGP